MASPCDSRDDEKLSAEDIARQPAWLKLDAMDCGDSAADRIIEDDEVDYMCGGALVSDRHVVTAAHCVQKSDYGPVLTTVRLGEHDTRTNPDCELKVCAPAVQDRGIKRIISHPLFNKPAFHNDVAIIELDTPVTLNIVSPALCDSFGKAFKLFESEICAGAEHNKDACGGDSGGPLMKVFDTPEGPKSYLVGVVSFGPTICGIKKPGVYASVAYFLKFILDHLV
ncbi:hypothetical protein HF086_003420 [Spodoptera exigua]|uniref:Peptidase S1 domain-containing protein n=1 Tax=Spodoptera exigua TaxID=7107 RepID=A0A922SFM9_SPOEX|nr:hypothetical protein HF086_003420 [Spodoptera exigua]